MDQRRRSLGLLACLSLVVPGFSLARNDAEGVYVRYGTGIPKNDLGDDGDFYIATDTLFVYGPKALGTWPPGVALIGKNGPLSSGIDVTDYKTLRAYAGGAAIVTVTEPGIAGWFRFAPADNSSKDNGGTIIVTRSGKRYKRLFGGALSVLWFGAKGDGVTDDTTAIQSAINTCSSEGVVVFPEGRTYRASNVKIKPGVRMQGEGRATLKALDSGNPAYFVATRSYAENIAQSVDALCEIDSLAINANNCKAIALGWRSFYGRVTKSKVFGATDTDVLVTTLGVSGAAMPVGSMVNNKFIDNWFGGADDYRLRPPQYVFKVNDPSCNKATDIIFSGNYVSGALKRVVHFGTAAGLLFQCNHVYGGDAEFRKGFMGFVCTGNFFENDVVIDDVTEGVAAAVFGPGNTLLTGLVAKFGAHGDHIVSIGNHYFGAARIRHCFNDVSKRLISIGDTFASPDPMNFYNNDGVTLQPSSDGIFKAIGSYLVHHKRDWNAQFSGKGKTYDSQAQPQNAASKIYLSKTFLEIKPPARTGTFTLSISMPALSCNGPPCEVEISANSNRRGNGSANLRYLAHGTVNKTGDGIYQFCMNNIAYTADQWRIAPNFSAEESGSIVTLKAIGTYLGDGANYCSGGGYLKAFN